MRLHRHHQKCHVILQACRKQLWYGFSKLQRVLQYGFITKGENVRGILLGETFCEDQAPFSLHLSFKRDVYVGVTKRLPN